MNVQIEAGSPICWRCDEPMFVTRRGIEPESGVSRPKNAECESCGETWERGGARRGDR